MPRVTQLTVACSNRPGTLAHVAQVLGSANVNIQGFLLRTSGPKGFIQLLVDNVARAKKALDRAGLPHTEETVLKASIPNASGALGRFAAKLAAKEINISSGFQTILKGSRRAVVVLEVSRLDAAIRVAANPETGRTAGGSAANEGGGLSGARRCHGASELHESCDRQGKRHCDRCGFWYCRTHFADPDWHACAPEQGIG